MMGVKGGIAIVILAIIMSLLTVMNFCVPCTGWNAINPLCLIASSLCMIWAGWLKLALGFGAFILFIIGVVVMVRK